MNFYKYRILEKGVFYPQRKFFLWPFWSYISGWRYIKLPTEYEIYWEDKINYKTLEEAKQHILCNCFKEVKRIHQI